jgi:threonine/homoserine efflux transporter RhtA
MSGEERFRSSGNSVADVLFPIIPTNVRLVSGHVLLFRIGRPIQEHPSLGTTPSDWISVASYDLD